MENGKRPFDKSNGSPESPKAIRVHRPIRGLKGMAYLRALMAQMLEDEAQERAAIEAEQPG